MKKTLIWVGALVLVTGVGLYINEQVKASYKLKYDYRNFKTPYIGRDKLVVEFDFIVKNSGDLKETITKIDIDVYGNDIFLTRIYTDKELVIVPNGETSVRLQMVLNPAMIYRNIGQISANGLNDMNLKFKGKISIKKLGIGIPIPFVYRTTYKEFMGV